MTDYDLWKTSAPEDPEGDAYDDWLGDNSYVDILDESDIAEILAELHYGRQDEAKKMIDRAVERAWQDYLNRHND